MTFVDDVPEAEETEVGVNSLVWITSLREAEQGVTNRILEDLEPYLAGLGIGFTRFEPESRDHLYAFLDDLRERAEGTFRPVIHLDMHGHPENGLHIVGSNENAPWPHMVEMFREINVATGNGLCVISLACFGFHIIEAVDFGKPAPFYALVASEREIAAGDIEERALRFYRRVFEVQDLGPVCEEVWRDSPRLWLAEKYLFEVLVNYVVKTTRGRFARERLERMVSKAREEGLPDNELSAFRKFIKEGLKPRPIIIENYGKRFFIARPIVFTFKQVMSAADKYQKRLDKAKIRGSYEPYFSFRRH